MTHDADTRDEAPESQRDTLTSPPPDMTDHERECILPGDLLLSEWREAERGR